MRKMHRTMRGQAFDMEALREKNANTVAAGNARMNDQPNAALASAM